MIVAEMSFAALSSAINRGHVGAFHLVRIAGMLIISAAYDVPRVLLDVRGN